MAQQMSVLGRLIVIFGGMERSMVSIAAWRGLPTAVWRGTPLALLPTLASQCPKGTVPPWFTKTDDEPITFTLVPS